MNPEKQPSPRFELGQVFFTPGAIDLHTEYDIAPHQFIRRHARGDWGDMAEEDKQANERALVDGSRIFSAYQVDEYSKLWVITEAVNEAGRREYTTELLPSEY